MFNDEDNNSITNYNSAFDKPILDDDIINDLRKKYMNLIEINTSEIERNYLLSEVAEKSKSTTYSHHFHRLILQYGCKLMSSNRFKEISNKYFPFMAHTNFKILLFLCIIGYAYLKLKKVTPKNHLMFRLLDDFWFVLILGIKNFYYQIFSKGFRSDIGNILKLVLIIFFNRICGGSTQRTLENDFFFSASGNVILSYFFM
ncbi:hypothetical protein ABK040_010031 [Willaertia magna]